jgi:hypothetical protein
MRRTAAHYVAPAGPKACSWVDRSDVLHACMSHVARCMSIGAGAANVQAAAPVQECDLVLELSAPDRTGSGAHTGCG